MLWFLNPFSLFYKYTNSSFSVKIWNAKVKTLSKVECGILFIHVTIVLFLFNWHYNSLIFDLCTTQCELCP